LLPDRPKKLTRFSCHFQERTFNVDDVGDADDVSEDESITSFETFRLKYGTELTPKQAQRVAEIVPKNMIVFRFVDYIFTAGQVRRHCIFWGGRKPTNLTSVLKYVLTPSV
jgi:hypothetical protein